MKNAAILVALVAFGTAQSISIPPPPIDPTILPSGFRSTTRHHERPCTNRINACLANHLMYLQCGAILIEKMALKDSESAEWHVYSVHSGPKVSLKTAGSYIPRSLDPSFPGMRYSGQEFDPMEKIGSTSAVMVRDPDLADLSNQHLATFIQQTLNWLDSQPWTLTDACELRSFWNELRGDSILPPEESTASEDQSNPVPGSPSSPE